MCKHFTQPVTASSFTMMVCCENCDSIIIIALRWYVWVCICRMFRDAVSSDNGNFVVQSFRFGEWEVCEYKAEEKNVGKSSYWLACTLFVSLAYHHPPITQISFSASVHSNQNHSIRLMPYHYKCCNAKKWCCGSLVNKNLEYSSRFLGSFLQQNILLSGRLRISIDLCSLSVSASVHKMTGTSSLRIL